MDIVVPQNLTQLNLQIIDINLEANISVIIISKTDYLFFHRQYLLFPRDHYTQ